MSCVSSTTTATWLHTPRSMPTSEESCSAHDEGVGSGVLQKPIAFSACVPQHPFPEPVGHMSITPHPHLPNITSI